jgi:hypothetical protein
MNICKVNTMKVGYQQEVIKIYFRQASFEYPTLDLAS